MCFQQLLKVLIVEKQKGEAASLGRYPNAPASCFIVSDAFSLMRASSCEHVSAVSCGIEKLP